MKTILENPTFLCHTAVMPQCLDDQFITDDLYARIVDNSESYHTPDIQEARVALAKREYRRSLIYHRQTVVNRAYFASRSVYDDYASSTPTDDRLAFHELVRESAIVPYLYNEREFRDVPLNDKLGFSQEAAAAAKDLFAHLDEVRCVRLHTDDKKNLEQTRRLAGNFGTFCTALNGVAADEAQMHVVMSEVFQREMGSGANASLAAALRKLAHWAFDRQGSAAPLSRRAFYEEFLCARKTTPQDGYFVKGRPEEHLLELKKLVDLRYNTNLPEYLRCHTLTPLGLPTHSTLDAATFGPSRDALEDHDKFLEECNSQIARTVMSRLADTYVLPSPSLLSIADVKAIRELPEWSSFIQAQQQMLDEPKKCLDFLEDYTEKQIRFQHAFSKWFANNYPDEQRVTVYGTVVRVAFKIGGLLAVKAVQGIDGIVELAGQTGAVEVADGHIAKWTARLMIDVVDAVSMKPDPRFSYSVDLIRGNQRILASEIRDVLSSFELAPWEGFLDAANAGGEFE